MMTGKYGARFRMQVFKTDKQKKAKNTFWIQSKHTLCDPPFFHSNHSALSHIFAKIGKLSLAPTPL
jgi:hypothetical protein